MKIHFESPPIDGYYLCGRYAVIGSKATTNPAEVTCARCLAALPGTDKEN